MPRITRTFTSALTILFVAGAIAPAYAYTSPANGAFHEVAFSTQKKTAPVTFQLYNRGEAVQQVKVAGQVYTLKPHSGVKITAEAGTQVYAATEGTGHHNGDLLFAVSKALKGDTVSID